MSRILLDTSAYSALFRKHQASVQLVESAESLYLTPIVLGELKAGFLLSRRGEENERALRELLQSPRVSVLVIDDETADRWAIIATFLKKSGTPVASNDIWIAAAAWTHDSDIRPRFSENSPGHRSPLSACLRKRRASRINTNATTARQMEMVVLIRFCTGVVRSFEGR